MGIGSKIKFDHQKVNAIINDFVMNVPPGASFTRADLSAYFESLPMHWWGKPKQGSTWRDLKRKLTNRTSLASSGSYFGAIASRHPLVITHRGYFDDQFGRKTIYQRVPSASEKENHTGAADI